MVKKKATDRKKGGVKKSGITIPLLRLPVKKGEAQRSYKALEESGAGGVVVRAPRMRAWCGETALLAIRAAE